MNDNNPVLLDICLSLHKSENTVNSQKNTFFHHIFIYKSLIYEKIFL